MTTSRGFCILLLWGLLSAPSSAQSHPKELTWAVGQLRGQGEWCVRLPELLMRGWAGLDVHHLSDAERDTLRNRFLETTKALAQQQASRALIELGKKQLKGPLPASEPVSTLKIVTDATAKSDAATAGTTLGADAPTSLPIKPVWAPERTSLPWPQSTVSELAEKSQALYLVTGEVRLVGDSLSARMILSSRIEGQTLEEWEDHFTIDEAPQRMASAADVFRSHLLGRPWAGLSVSSPIAGTRVRVADQWHDLPWTSALLEPGVAELIVRAPGRPDQGQSVVLEAGKRIPLAVGDPTSTAQRLVLETDPPGVSLYMDSQYLGPSPQTIDRPTATTRVRAQAPGWETVAWEVGPESGPISHATLIPPQKAADIPSAKDRFYLSLAAFSFSLTSSAFATAWAAEQVNLANSYQAAGDQNGWDLSYQRWQQVSVVKWSAVALTSGLFVWMMVELGDYLKASQASLP